MKPKGVTTQMKTLDEYILMVVFMLLLNRVHIFANFMFNLNRETWQRKSETSNDLDHGMLRPQAFLRLTQA